MKILRIYVLLFAILLSNQAVLAEDVPKFKDYAANKIYKGKYHPLVLNEYGKMYRTRLREALKHPVNFAGHYIVTGWGCGSGGCNTCAVINVKTGIATSCPVTLMSVYPLKPEYEDKSGQEHIFRKNSRLMIFAGVLDTLQGQFDDVVEFYTFEGGKFKFLKRVPYNHKGESDY